MCVMGMRIGRCDDEEKEENDVKFDTRNKTVHQLISINVVNCCEMSFCCEMLW